MFSARPGKCSLWLLLAAALAACSGASPSRPAGAPGGAPPHRVILISLDGAAAQTLQELHRQGALRAGGFERFFRDGQVAEALIPVDPTLTATNHISLVTGFPPAATGIVGNEFFPGGSIAAQRLTGFNAPIGTETLWEAAQQQGKQVGILTWPGADAKDAKDETRRTGTWGLVYNDSSEHAPQVFDLARGDWQPSPADPGRWTARLPIKGVEGSADTALDLVAVDGTDDGRTSYDGVEVTGPADSSGQRARVLLRAGSWGQIAWPLPGARATSRLKLVALAPDLASARLFFDGAFRTISYPGTLSAELAGAGLDSPGPPDSGRLVAGWQGKPGIDLETWTEQAEHLAGFFGRALRFAAARPDWDLLLCYIPVIDQAGHRLLLLDERQADFSPERRDDMVQARTRVWQAVDAQLQELLAGLDLTRTTVVVVSDHGMAPAHTSVDPNALLAELGPKASAVPNGGAAHVYVDESVDLADLARRYAAWQVNGEAPVEKVVNRQEAARLGLDHPNGGGLVLFARPGFVFRGLPKGTASGPAPVYGAHGYLATHPEMQAVYMAIGAGVEPGRNGTVRATDVAPRVAAWLGIEPPRRSVP